jgi:AAA family ATP:ADP antiporter
MLTASAVLVLCVVLLVVVDRREGAKSPDGERPHEEPLKADKIFRKLAQDRYLLLIAALTLVLNWVNNNGEYLVDRTLLVATKEHADALHMTHALFISQFKSAYFFYYNVGGVGLQLFGVSRIIKLMGVRGALYVLPFISFAGYLAVALFPTLRVVEMTKVAENSVDYSLQNTARQALFLVTDRVGKYIGKTVIDTFMMRLGDVFAALTVALGTRLALDTRKFALVNLVLVLLWGATLLFLGREHRKRSAEAEAQERRAEQR